MCFLTLLPHNIYSSTFRGLTGSVRTSALFLGIDEASESEEESEEEKPNEEEAKEEEEEEEGKKTPVQLEKKKKKGMDHMTRMTVELTVM